MNRVPLLAVRDNPYQTRTQYGQQIAELAESIFNTRLVRPDTSGLVQVPPGRLWDLDAGQPIDPANLDDGELLPLLDGGLVVVQLAAGHRRFRAFSYLAEHLPADQALTYKTFPVELGLYTDENMADLVWTENHDRADLSPVEEAEALRRDMQAFGWTQVEIGLRRGLSRSAVANKLRLLNLPDDARAAIRTGILTERHGRVLLKAQAMTPTIYKALADDLIPLPVPDAVADQARALRSKVARVFKHYYCNGSCSLCSASAHAMLKMSDGGEVGLCEACMRIATGWEPPTVAMAENMLDDIVYSASNRISFFPLDVEIKPINGKNPLVRQPACTGCPMLVQARGQQSCIDGACFVKKTELWQEHLSLKLWLCVQDRWSVEPRIDFNSYGSMMHATEEIDRYLAKNVCGPQCPHFVLRYYPHDDDVYIRPVPYQPFICACESGQAYQKCIRKLGKDEAAQAQLGEHNAALAEQQRNKQQMLDLYNRAVRALADRIESDPAGMIVVLAQAVDKDGRPYQALAKWLMSRNYDIMPDAYHGVEWTPEHTAKYKQKLTNRMGSWGIKLAPSADELIAKVNKIEEFVQLNADHLTPAQVRGNIDNLERFMTDLTQANIDHVLSETDYNRLYQNVLHLHTWLTRVSQETRRAHETQRDRLLP